ncbi:(2Fe-2S)-binding protein [Kiloniella sp. EL199]|uniref:(2Fe-2S)-binding protein n=1 Tax=Kiloniella sp. EL199 TaxID=2107581 RepID=UPI000EA324B5|nr:(2Fe-2S)-binding protein [Kiloniella sp. EL199]
MKITVNKIDLTIPEQHKSLSLLNYLRDVLGLTGTKYGCGQGLCGACTVHLDGQAVRACQTSIEEIDGQAVTTIEGLSVNGLHPLQKIWIKNAVPQCGYCQAGQLMSASALLKENSQPSTAEIRNAMSGNLCRCGTYPKIEAAINEVVRGG